MTELAGRVGFAPPLTDKTTAKRRRAGVEFVAVFALAVSLIVAASAVSIGMARAQSLPAAISASRTLSVATFLQAVMAGKIH